MMTKRPFQLPSQLIRGEEMWLQRADALATAAVPPLLWLRKHEGWPLTPTLLRNGIKLSGLIGLACIGRLPKDLRDTLNAYIDRVPFIDIRFSEHGKPKFDSKTWNRALARAGVTALASRDPIHACVALETDIGWRARDRAHSKHGFAEMYVQRSTLKHLTRRSGFRRRLGYSPVIGWRARRLLARLADFIEANELPMIPGRDTLELDGDGKGGFRVREDTAATLSGALVLMDLEEGRALPGYLDDEFVFAEMKAVCGAERTYPISGAKDYARERLRLSAEIAGELFKGWPPGFDGLFGPVPTTETYNANREKIVRQLRFVVAERVVDWEATAGA